MTTGVEKSFTGNARRAQLAGAITAVAVTFTLDDATGFPTGSSYPFVVTIGRGTALEERVLVTSRSGNVFTVTTRGYDSTTAVAHSASETVEHTTDAVLLTDTSTHLYDVTQDDHTQYIKTSGSRAFTGSTAIAASPTVTLSTTASAGALHTFIRSDATIIAFDATSPSTQAVGDSAATGSAAVAARRDHKHALPAFGAVTAQTSFGASSANGSATTIARSDHTHGTPATPAVSLTSVTNALSGNVTMTNANTFYDGPSVALTAGTWLVTGVLTVKSTGTESVTAKLWDGTTSYCATEKAPGTNGWSVFPVTWIITTAGTPTIKISAASTGTTEIIRAAPADNSPGNFASVLTATKIV